MTKQRVFSDFHQYRQRQLKHRVLADFRRWTGQFSRLSTNEMIAERQGSVFSTWSLCTVFRKRPPKARRRPATSFGRARLRARRSICMKTLVLVPGSSCSCMGEGSSLSGGQSRHSGEGLASSGPKSGLSRIPMNPWAAVPCTNPPLRLANRHKQGQAAGGSVQERSRGLRLNLSLSHRSRRVAPLPRALPTHHARVA